MLGHRGNLNSSRGCLPHRRPSDTVFGPTHLHDVRWSIRFFQRSSGRLNLLACCQIPRCERKRSRAHAILQPVIAAPNGDKTLTLGGPHDLTAILRNRQQPITIGLYADLDALGSMKANSQSVYIQILESLRPGRGIP
jgi:hypothetical protein